MATDVLRIGGARVHNLKDVSLEIPRNKLVVITGPSGSGKSSLAFDTIFAEGQRKYVESLSSYARQFLDQLQKPDVDYIEGLSPAIAIEQRTAGANPRSLIATTTEIYDYLRLLYANAGRPHCPESGEPIASQTTTEIIDEILSLPPKTRAMVLAPAIQDQKGEFRDVLEKLAREGFVRARIDRQFIELAANLRHHLKAESAHRIEVVVDRLVVDEKVRTRLGDSVETALKWGRGLLILLHQSPLPDGSRPEGWEETLFSNRLYSPATGKTYDPPTPKHFSFNSPAGACAHCHGLGQVLVFDEDLAVPNPEKSLEQGAVVPWRKAGKKMAGYYEGQLRDLCDYFGQDFKKPFQQLSESFRRVLFHGSGKEKIPFRVLRSGRLETVEKSFEGLLPNLNRMFQESASEKVRTRLKGYMGPRTCDACRGFRLKPEVLAVTLGEQPSGNHPAVPGYNIMDVCQLSVEEADDFLKALDLTDFQKKIAGDVVREIRSRLEFLRRVGLGYLSLNRESGTLSGGEAQRIRLATQIGAGLVGVLYILDEPSIGLHQRDNDRLLESLRGLRDLGNSVLVVEHDEDTIRSADYIVDLGPGAGVRGGEVVAVGSVEDISNHPKSLTGKYLRGEYEISVPKRRREIFNDKGYLEIEGASENNLRNIRVRFPLGAFICVTGVSGSGKSTLVDDILRKALYRRWYGSKDKPGAYSALRGVEKIDKAIVVDQSPIGRTPRSNPATYTGMFVHIRELFALLPAAKIRGYGAGRFSFNVKGGRCEKCQGDGLIRIEMHFLPPVYVVCEACDGRRYNRETLEIHYKGMNIADVLDMTVDEAVRFFRAIPKVQEPCEQLQQVGLGYITLGQAATTLSGGEAQRIKLAAELSRKSTGNTLYLMDEPTTGLHFHDVAKLLDVLLKLRDAGNTLVVIEHHLDMIKNADWIVDLGPEGGKLGGRVVAEGSPEDVAANPESHTGRYLRRYLK